jgi:hypothetical protein
LPWTPKALLAVEPGGGNCQAQQLVNWNVVPGLAPVRVPTFHWLVIVTCSGKARVTVQLLNAVVRLLVTDTSSWKKVPAVFEGVAVQLTPPLVELLELELLLDELLEEEELELLLDDELEAPLLEEELELLLDDELAAPLLEEELELLLDDELDELLLEAPPVEIVPAEAVRVTRSSLEPSSRLLIRSVCAPAARLVKVAGVMVA